MPEVMEKIFVSLKENQFVRSAIKGAFVGVLYFGMDYMKSKISLGSEGITFDIGDILGQKEGKSKGYYDYMCEMQKYRHEERMAEINKGSN